VAETIRSGATAVPGGAGAKGGGAWLRKTESGFRPEAGYVLGEGTASNAEAGYETGTSIFDPVLTECVYRWFCPPGGIILDPFSGGSIRGIVASKLGHPYIGIDLSERQIAANYQQAETICSSDSYSPEWRVGDSTQLDEIAADVQADLIFSCPPYADLERYSDDPRDLSTMPYPRFLELYRIIIAAAARRLRHNRFACFVVGDVRGKDGFYYGFPHDTVRAFTDAGLRLYNSAVLVTATGSLPVRAGRAFSSGRKLGRTHQDVYIFVKGDWKRAAEACGNIEE
jgi:hypothetical protein